MAKGPADQVTEVAESVTVPEDGFAASAGHAAGASRTGAAGPGGTARRRRICTEPLIWAHLPVVHTTCCRAQRRGREKVTCAGHGRTACTPTGPGGLAGPTTPPRRHRPVPAAARGESARARWRARTAWA